MKHYYFIIATAFAAILSFNLDLSAKTWERHSNKTDFTYERCKYEPYITITSIIPGQNKTKMLSLDVIYSVVFNEQSAIGLGVGIMASSMTPQITSVTPDNYLVKIDAPERRDFNPSIKTEFTYRFNRRSFNETQTSERTQRMKRSFYPFITFGAGYMFLKDKTYQFSVTAMSPKDPEEADTWKTSSRMIPLFGNIDLGIEYNIKDGPKIYGSLSCTLLDLLELYSLNFESQSSDEESQSHARATLRPNAFNLAVKVGVRF